MSALAPAPGAAVNLLASTGMWLDRPDFAAFTSRDGAEMTVDWKASVAALDAGQLPCGPPADAVLLFAAALAAGDAVAIAPLMMTREVAGAIEAAAIAAGRDPASIWIPEPVRGR